MKIDSQPTKYFSFNPVLFGFIFVMFLIDSMITYLHEK